VVLSQGTLSMGGSSGTIFFEEGSYFLLSVHTIFFNFAGVNVSLIDIKPEVKFVKSIRVAIFCFV